MLIGIDMLGVQSPGRRRARGESPWSTTCLDPPEWQLYPSLRSLYPPGPAHAPGPHGPERPPRLAPEEGSDGPAKLRPIIQRVLDNNPDGLDWLVLLDPFDVGYGGMPPESPLNGVKIASMITDLAPSRVDDRRLAPLRRHDAILALRSRSTADECRLRMPTAEGRITRIGLGVDTLESDIDAFEPLSESTATELGRLGIVGPFLLANMASGADRSNLGGVLEAYHRISMEHQRSHQLVVAGDLDDPWAAIAYLQRSRRR